MSFIRPDNITKSTIRQFFFMDLAFEARLFYFVFHRLYGHGEQLCIKEISDDGDEDELHIYQSAMAGFQGDLERSKQLISDVEECISKVVVEYCVCKHLDPNHPIDLRVIKCKYANPRDIEISASILVFFMEEFAYQEVFEFAHPVFHGWFLIFSKLFSQAIEFFNDHKNNELAAYGTLICLFHQKKFTQLSIIDTISFPEVKFEKARILASQAKWSEAAEIALAAKEEPIISQLEVEIFLTLDAILSNKTTFQFEQIVDLCKKYESKNWLFTCNLAFSFAALLFHDKSIHILDLAMYESNHFTNTVMSYHYLLLNNLLAANEAIIRAFTQGTSMLAFEVQIRINLMLDNEITADDLLQSIEGIERTNLSMKIFYQYKKRAELIESIESHLTNQTFFDYDFFHEFRPDILAFALDQLEGVPSLILNKLLHIAPKYPPFRYAQAVTQKKKGEIFAAINAFDELLTSKIVYREITCLTHLAEISLIVHMPNIAYIYLNEALKLDKKVEYDPKFLSVYLQAELDTGHSIQKPPTVDLSLQVGDYQNALDLLAGAKMTPYNAMALAQIQAGFGKIDLALEIIDKIIAHKKYKLKALEVKANIYLKHLNDKIKFIEFIKKTNNLEMLGDSYQRINMYDDAIDAYYRALEKMPTEITRLKLVQLLKKTHQYDKIAELFNGLVAPNEIIEILINSKQHMAALSIIEANIEAIKEMKHLGMFYFEKAKIFNEKQKYEEAEEFYLKAIESLRLKLSVSHNFKTNMKKYLSRIYFELGNVYININQKDKAVGCFNHSIKYNKGNTDAAIVLYDITQNIDLLVNCLKENPSSERAILILSNVQSLRSMKYISKALKMDSTRTRLLIRYIELSARFDYLQKPKKIIKKSPNPFCKGLISYYLQEKEKAMEYFRLSIARNIYTNESKKIIFSMLVNPERKYVWHEERGTPFFEKDNLQEITSLLRSITGDETQKLCYRAELELAYNTLSSIQNAQSLYLQIKDVHNVERLIGLARCEMCKDNIVAVNEYIDEILTLPILHEYYSFYEEALLMRTVMTENPFDAQDFVKLAISINYLNPFSWMLLGRISAELKNSEDSYKAYVHCWRILKHKNADIGIELAKISIDDLKYDEAMCVAHDVYLLKSGDDNIRRDLIYPAYAKLKPYRAPTSSTSK